MHSCNVLKASCSLCSCRRYEPVLEIAMVMVRVRMMMKVLMKMLMRLPMINLTEPERG